MDISSFIGTLWRRRSLILGVMLAALGVGVAILIRATPIYEAQVLILIDPDRSFEETKGGDAFSNASRQNQYLKTQVQIAQGDSVLKDVVEKIGPDAAALDRPSTLANLQSYVKNGLRQLTGSRSAPTTDDVETRNRIRDIRQSLKVEVEANTDILKLSFRDRDPVRAQRVADRIAASFIERHTKLYSNPMAARFFRDQEEASRATLTDAETKFRNFSLGTDSYSLDEQKKLLLERRDKSLADLASTQNSIQRTSAEVTAIRTQLASLRAKMNLPEEIFGPNNFKSGRGSDGNLNDDPPLLHVRLYQDSAQRLVTLNAELAGLKASETSQLKEVGAINKLLVNFANQDAEFSALRRAVEEAERNIELYSRRGAEAQIANAWRTNENLSNMQVVEQATAPTSPVFPRASMILPLSILIGVVMGAGLAVLIDALAAARRTGDEPAAAATDGPAGSPPESEPRSKGMRIVDADYEILGARGRAR